MADSPSSIVTVTAVFTATQSTSLITVTPTSTSPPPSSTGSGGPAIAPIVGGAVGGLVGLVVLAGVLWLCMRRGTKSTLDGMFEDSIDTHTIPPVRSRRSESEHAPLDANRSYARPGVFPTPQTVSQNPTMSQMQHPQQVTGAPPVSGYWVYHPEPQPPLTSPNATSQRPLSSASSTIPLRNDEAQFVPHHTNSHSMSSAGTHQMLPRHASLSSTGTGAYHGRPLSAGSGSGSGSAPYNPYTDFAPPSGGSRQSSSDQRQAQPLYLVNHAAVSASSVATPTPLSPSTSSKTVPPPPQQTQPRPTRVVVHDDFGSVDAHAGFGVSSSSAGASSSAPMSTPTPDIPGDEPPAYF